MALFWKGVMAVIGRILRGFWDFGVSPAGHLALAILAAVLSLSMLVVTVKNGATITNLRDRVAIEVKARGKAEDETKTVQRDLDQCVANRRVLQEDLNDQNAAVDQLRAEGDAATKAAQRALAEERRRGQVARDLSSSIMGAEGDPDRCIAADEFLKMGAY